MKEIDTARLPSNMETKSQRRKKAKIKAIPPHLKYPKYLTPDEERAESLLKVTPSTIIEEMKSKLNEKTVQLKRPVPEIIEFLDLENNTLAVVSSVRVDEPIFQPYPLNLQFRDYEPFGTYKQTLYFRNNDSVPRRITVQPPDSPYFSIQRNPRSQDRVAAGMETSYEVTFRPNEKKEYHQRLICITEREKFIVEISALGPWSCINFPDEVRFGTCPVNYKSEQTFLIRNIGEKDTKFSLSATETFNVIPKSGFLPIDGAMQITVEYLPEECVEYEGELEIIYDNGQKVYTRLLGHAENVPVRLETPLIELESTYITLETTWSFKILNDSEIPIEFNFKSFRSKREESEERARLHEELNRLEAKERLEIEMKVYDDDHQQSETETCGKTIPRSFKKKTELAMLAKRFQQLHTSVGTDDMHFVDPNFTISPLKGQVWSHSEKDISVTFSPSVADNFVSIACLTVSGREHRLPLKMIGQGIGPKAAFSYTNIDVHDVFITSVHRYELQLENLGDIKCVYELLKPESLMGSYFHFSPSKGILDVEESHVIKVIFCSDKIGPFNECFHFNLHGSNETLKVRFAGNVIGPTFEFDIEELNFERVPFGFVNERNFRLQNTSDIPMTYNLSVLGDGKFNEKEFIITPNKATLQSKQSQDINLKFISKTIMEYAMSLDMDIEGVGERVFKLPIKAQCIVPEVAVIINDQNLATEAHKKDMDVPEDDENYCDNDSSGDERLRFGQCFIRYEYKMPFILRNQSDVQARFEIANQDQNSFCVARYTASPANGIIESQSEIEIEVTLSCHKLGKISVPMFIQIDGSDKPPIMIDLRSTSIGPRIVFDQQEIDYGPIQCLTTVKRSLCFTNDSLVVAPFKTYMKGSKSRFDINCYEGCLEPGESITCEVSANADDTILHQDELHIVVTEGMNTIIPLKAKGIGTTMFCATMDDLKKTDFKTLFTNRPCEWTFLLENRGRRDQLLKWTNLTQLKRMNEYNKILKDKERMIKDKDAKVQKQGKMMKIPQEPCPIFSMFPEQLILKPHMGCLFKLKGESQVSAQVLENFVLEAKVGKNAKIATKVVESEFKATFINPLIEASEPVIEFEYTCDRESNLDSFCQLAKPLKLKNLSQLPLNFILRTQVPFSVDTWEISLKPNEENSINVMCDPLYRDDRQSHLAEGKLVAIHQNHPQRDTFPIKAQINFPNLKFEKTKVDFGCILNDTSEVTTLTLTNDSKVGSSFSWSFYQDESKGMKNKKGDVIAINQIFDFRPMKGYLRPGEQIDVEIIFYGHANMSVKTAAVCTVEGGPEYEVQLIGAASEILYRIDKTSLDFGDIIHDQSKTMDIVVSNQGKVAFDFRAVLDDVLQSRAGMIECSPLHGTIQAKETQTLTVRFTPGVPDAIAENLILEIAHFEPLSIPIYGRGMYASVSFQLPRHFDSTDSNEIWKKQCQEAASSLKSSSVEFAAKFELFKEGDSLSTSSTLHTLRSLDTWDMKRSLLQDEGKWTTHSIPETNKARRERKKEVKSKKTDKPSSSNASALTKQSQKQQKEILKLNRKIEAEANRIKFVEFLLKQPDFVPASPPLPPNKTVTQPFTIATYIIDFGNVIIGTTRKQSVRLVNTGTFPVSLNVEKPNHTHNFGIEPNQVLDLKEGGYVDFVVQYSARRGTPTGNISIDVPIDIKSGPPVMLKIQAHVTIPDVSLHISSLDYGSMVIGECKVMTVQIRNISPVATEWSINGSRLSSSTKRSRAKSRRQDSTAKSEDQGSGDISFFVCKTDSGVLQPGYCCNVDIVFTPTEKRSYQARVPIYIHHNPKPKIITCFGKGEMLELELSDSLIELGPTLPFADTVTKSLTLQNKSSRDIEVYSLEFDNQYRVEENILHTIVQSNALNAGSLDSDSISIRPRKPGESLPQRLIDVYNKIMTSKEKKKNIVPSEDDVGNIETTLIGDPEHTEHSIETSLTNRDRGLAVDMVIYGPPISGKSQYAKQISKILGGVPILIIDEVLEWAAKSGILPEPVCKKYSLSTETDQISKSDGEDDSMTVELLAKAIRTRVFEADASSGVVFDNIFSTYLCAEGVGFIARGLKLAFLPKAGSIYRNIPKSHFGIVFLDENMSSDDIQDKIEGMNEYLNSKNTAENISGNHEGYSSEENSKLLQRVQNPAIKEEVINYFASLSQVMHIFEREAPKVIHSAIGDKVNEESSNLVEETKEGIYNADEKQKEPENREVELKELSEQNVSIGNPATAIHVVSIDGIDTRTSEATLFDPKLDEEFPRPGTPRSVNTKSGWKLAVPPASTYQLLAKPNKRKAPQMIERFSIRKRSTTSGISEDDPDGHHDSNKFRWVIPAGENLVLDVCFSSNKLGKFESQLMFEIVGGQREYWTVVKGICTVPMISADPRNVFMNRIKSRQPHKPVSRKYVIANGVYEFGPLLVGKTYDMRDTDPALKNKNCETFRFSNSGVLPIESLDLCVFAEGSPDNQADSPFIVIPQNINLLPGETKDVTVWAFPQLSGQFKGRLMASIKDNPELIEFPISCLGAKPILRVEGPWDNNDDLDEVNNAGQNYMLKFERLLLRHNEEKSFSIKNDSTIPLQWKLDLGDIQNIDELNISPTEGILSPGETRNITVEFFAIKEATFETEIKLTYSDIEYGNDDEKRQTKVAVNISAEAYDIQVKPDYTQEGESSTNEKGGLDFGTLRVFESREKTFTLKNYGKYAVSYNFKIRRRVSRELFRIQPMEGIIEAGETENFTVTFFSKAQVRIKDNKDIQCTIMERKTGEVFETFKIATCASSVFSQFKVHPNSINFGANKYETSPERYFDIKNEGEFEFSYQILNDAGIREECNKLIEAENSTKVTAAYTEEGIDEPIDPYEWQKRRALPNTDIPTDTLKISDSFSVDKQGGNVSPGKSERIKVRFDAKGHMPSRSRIQIIISGRNEEGITRTQVGMPFEIMGESCIPGINTENYESIFEEQAIVRVLNPESDIKGVFATEERRFSFGAVIPTSVDVRGVCERFKISNPTNVKATVNLEIASSNPDNECVFSVQPSSIELPSHEYQFVCVYFKPVAMSEYCAKFSASVVDGTDPKTDKLEFDLYGEGTLPCLTIIEPSALTDEACLLVDFGRVPVGKRIQKPIILRNDGVVPAVVRFDMKLHDSFSFPGRNTSCNLKAKESSTSQLHFRPATPGKFESELLVRVLYNEFELSTIKMVGEAFQEDLTFEDLPDDFDDELHFGDVILSKEDGCDGFGKKTINFNIRNNCSNPLRFEWGTQTNFEVLPNVGHIPPFGLIPIEASIVCNEVMTLESHSLEITCKKIQYTESAFAAAKGKSISWNSKMKMLKHDDENQEKSVLEIIPEPDHIGVEGSEEKKMELKCFAEVDFVKYDCPLSNPFEIKFRPTMMFQSRVYRFPIKNTGRVKLRYKWNLSKGIKSSCPFIVTPSEGIVDPGVEESLSFRFSPMEVEEFSCLAHAEIDGLSTTMFPALDISLKGQARRPICHFDMEKSDYLERRVLGQSVGEVVGLDRDVRVLELESLGTKIKNTRRFFVINPTNIAYNFTLDPVGDVTGQFSCLTQQGLILPGRKYEIVFTFTPDKVELQEMLWKFSIPEQEVKQNILLVGRVAEPNVSLERRHVNFHAVLIGGRTSETVNLINNEHIPFSFSFDKSSFQIEDKSLDDATKSGTNAQVLSIQPMNGTVGPNDKLPLEIKFAPGEEKAYNFNLVCKVHRKPEKLSLNVKGEGSAVHDKLTLDMPLESSDRDASLPGQEILLTSGDDKNYIDFGEVHVNDRVKRDIRICNRGKYNFDFMWNLPPGVGETTTPSSAVAFYPIRGTVPCGEHITCTLEFNPTEEMGLKDILLECTVAGARKYSVVVSGRGSKPSLGFSFFRYDFGPCFVAEKSASARPEEHILTISNNETQNPVAVDCLFEKTDHIEVTCAPTVLQPGESVRVPIRFTPRQLTKYSEVIPFEINGLYTSKIVVSGEGIVLKVELERPESQQTVNFGSLRVGQEVSKVVKLINRSKRATYLSLKDGINEETGYLQEQFVTFAPHGEIYLRPREVVPIELYYNPERRQSPFSEKLFVELNGIHKPLLVVNGACQGVEVKLETDMLSFGSVCERCMLTRKLCIRNTGDLGARFHWDPLSLSSPAFKIVPMEGFIPAHSPFMFDVIFEPATLSDDFRCEALCIVEGNDVSALPLVLSGTCVPQPEEGIKEMSFSTRVREAQTNTIDIQNPDKTTWFLQPTINNDLWSGPERLEVPAGSTVKYEITYLPLTMTSKEGTNRHEGSAFFSLPNGTSILYKLFGEASEPEAQAIISENATAKQSLNIGLPVKNWLNFAQRFEVVIEKLTEHGDVAVTHFYRGAPTIDVPGMKSRNYKLQFIGYLEGKSTCKITLKNVETGEYLFYNVNVNCGKPGIQSEISLEAPVRQSCSDFIIIKNPFPPEQEVIFAKDQEDESWWDCDDAAMKSCLKVKQVSPMMGHNEGTFEITYRPLFMQEKENNFVEKILTLRSQQLGDFHYKLKLGASKPNTERSMHFRTTLGASAEQVFRFKHFATSATEFQCVVGQSAFFHVSPTIKVEPAPTWEGSDVTIQVKFEPQFLGDVKDTLVVSSPQAGNYTCSLYGKCEPPRPKGPITISNDGKGTNISFKNVFNEAKEFRFAVDSEYFTVEGNRVALQKIDPSKEINVVVKSVGSHKEKERMGKLLVSCVSMKDMPPWVFYLRGDSN